MKVALTLGFFGVRRAVLKVWKKFRNFEGHCLTKVWKMGKACLGVEKVQTFTKYSFFSLLRGQ